MIKKIFALTTLAAAVSAVSVSSNAAAIAQDVTTANIVAAQGVQVGQVNIKTVGVLQYVSASGGGLACCGEWDQGQTMSGSIDLGQGQATTRVNLRADQGGATLVYRDREGNNLQFASYGTEILSVGDVNNKENDDFTYSFLDDNVYGFKMEVVDNNKKSGEGFVVTLKDGTTSTFGVNSYLSSISGVDTYGFVTNGAAIASIKFNESSDGDDMGLRDFTVSTVSAVSAVPLPAAAWLFISAIAGLAGAKRLSRSKRTA